MDSIRVSEAPDPGSIPGEATTLTATTESGPLPFKDGLAATHVRLTINGQRNEISPGAKNSRIVGTQKLNLQDHLIEMTKNRFFNHHEESMESSDR